MYLGNSDMELLLLAAWCKNLPADMADNFHGQVFNPTRVEQLDNAGLLMVTKNGKCIRLREKGWRLLRYLGVGYHKDKKYRSDYERRLEIARILLTFRRAGYDVFGAILGDLGASQVFVPSMVARRDAVRGGDIWGGAGFWGLGRIRNTIAACYHVTGHEKAALNYRNEKAMLDKAATIHGTEEAMIFAGSGYERLVRAIGNTVITKASDKGEQRTFSEIYRNATTPIHLLECSDNGAWQLLITAQENYKKRLAEVVFLNLEAPPVGVTGADALMRAPEASYPLLISIDMDMSRIDRAYRQTITAGYPELVIACLESQKPALLQLYGDKRTKIVSITNKNLHNAFGTLLLFEPPEGVFIDRNGGMVDAAALPVH